MRGLARNQRLIMEVLAERGRAHAYEIKRILKGVIGHGSVHQSLSAIEAKGYVTTEWAIPSGRGSEGGGPPRKYIELTDRGREVLAENMALAVR